MLSKSQIKLITSLQQKKYRVKTGLFVAEGEKIIQDLINGGLELQTLYTTQKQDFGLTNSSLISEKDLKKISFLKTPNTCLALFKIPHYMSHELSSLTLVLDGVSDPGNLGTIIRLCDWFDVEQIICSEHTVDCFNNKVIQATMGSIARVKVKYLNIVEFLLKTTVPIYGACMNGDSVYQQNLPEQALLILGNEGHGISKEIIDLLDYKLTIPKFGEQPKAESLNVATASAILLSEFKRR
ncbi:MAG: TrmH family RNA methyltransferase [Flavobacteriales bacterium]